MQKAPRLRSRQHLDWVRDLPCAACGQSWQPCDPAHVRRGTQGGTGLKPGDNHVVPLCSAHHREQHSIGEASFERRYGLDMKALAERIWTASPYRQKGFASQTRT